MRYSITDWLAEEEERFSLARKWKCIPLGLRVEDGLETADIHLRGIFLVVVAICSWS